MRSMAAALFALLLLGSGLAGADEARERVDAARVRETAPLTLAKVDVPRRRGWQVADNKAAPAPKVTCDVIEFHASKTGTPSIDVKLAKHKKALGQPPLSSFDTFKVTGTGTVSIGVGKTGTVQNTAKLDLLFKGTVKSEKKERLQLEVTVDDATGSRHYRQVHTQDSGATVIHSAGEHAGGQLFIAVTCSLS